MFGKNNEVHENCQRLPVRGQCLEIEITRCSEFLMGPLVHHKSYLEDILLLRS